MEEISAAHNAQHADNASARNANTLRPKSQRSSCSGRPVSRTAFGVRRREGRYPGVSLGRLRLPRSTPWLKPFCRFAATKNERLPDANKQERPTARAAMKTAAAFASQFTALPPRRVSCGIASSVFAGGRPIVEPCRTRGGDPHLHASAIGTGGIVRNGGSVREIAVMPRAFRRRNAGAKRET